MDIMRFFAALLLLYLLIVYLWSKFGNLPIIEVESQIWAFLFKWWRENTQAASPDIKKFVPVEYAEQIHDSIRNYTNNSFNMTIWQNGVYSDFEVPCFTMDIVPRNNNIDADLPIIEVQALDHFQKCTLVDNLLASRIISKKIMGKVYLYILYASNDEELKRYNQLLEHEKKYADKIGLQNAAPISDSNLSEAFNLFDDIVGDSYAQN